MDNLRCGPASRDRSEEVITIATGTGRQDWRRRWAHRQNVPRRQAFDAAVAAWQRDDDEARRMLAAARDFPGLDAGQVAPYLALHRGETAYWLLPAVAMVETAAPVALPPPTYADILPHPSTPGPPIASRTIDAGVAIVTNQRIVLVGAHRREWQYTKLVGLAHLPDNRTTLMRVANRVKVSGLRMEPDAAPSFRFNVALGLAEFANDRAGFVRHLEQQLARHQARRPQPPHLATAEQAPLSARLGSRPMIGAAVIAILVLCGLTGIIGLLAPRSDPQGLSSGQGTPAATTAAEQPPPTPAAPTTTAAAPTSRPPTTRPTPRPTTKKPQPRPVAKKPTPRPTQTTRSVRRGVHPGAFCSPRGAFGLTSAGTLMQCKPSATDSRNRWRRA